MRRLAVAFAAILLVSAPLAEGGAALDETRITLRQEVLRLINSDREKHGLAPVALDPEASVVADAYCREQIANGTTGHFTTDGLAPYMRYSFAGGNDGVSENTAAWSANYSFTDRAVYGLVRRSEETMVAEKPPHDGHRRTILDPYATHVGIGLAWDKGEFRMTQEFIRRYVTWSRTLPRVASAADPVSASGMVVRGYRVQAVSVHHEPAPEQMPALVANAIESYSLPEKRHDYVPGARSYVHQQHNGSFNFAVPLRDGPGVYTVVVWVAKSGGRNPIAASNVSIRVNETYSGTR
ncbi:MAG TPA: CAP domain-containing protein [Thermoanaerobaculia bacterium]|nr:CAP domain-containing protein [Thermoanaerobaculia bacterium]